MGGFLVCQPICAASYFAPAYSAYRRAGKRGRWVLGFARQVLLSLSRCLYNRPDAKFDLSSQPIFFVVVVMYYFGEALPPRRCCDSTSVE